MTQHRCTTLSLRRMNEWLREAYPTLSPEQKPIECTLSAGELLYFPSMWDHATLNLDNYTSFVSSFQ
eukprot:COSAG06_NODE_7436_length_2505_cov_2.783458_3_plen_67_part_00